MTNAPNGWEERFEKAVERVTEDDGFLNHKKGEMHFNASWNPLAVKSFIAAFCLWIAASYD